MAEDHDFPTNSEVYEFINSDDLFVLSIKGHQAIETALNFTISEGFVQPHVLEVKKINFMLKVDLAVAMGILDSNLRPIFEKINSIRNRFAHQRKSTVEEKEGKDLFNLLPAEFRKVVGITKFENSKNVLSYTIAGLFMSVKVSVARQRDEKAYEEVLHEMVVETIGTPKSNSKHLSDVNSELRERENLKREKRKSQNRI
jgi:hypothetical protein